MADTRLYICLDEPHRTFSPGDRISGRVVLSVAKPTRSLYLSLRLLGQVSVSVSRSSHVKEAFLDKLLILSGDYNNKDPVLLEPAEYAFEFIYNLPVATLPSSVQFGKGAISYSLRCTHRRPWSLTARRKESAELHLNVSERIDIAQFNSPPPKWFTLQQPTPINFFVQLSRGALVRGTHRQRWHYSNSGDTLNILIKITHSKPAKNLRGIIITLYRLSRIQAKGARHSFRKDLAQVVLPVYVNPESLSFSANPHIRIPADVFPTVANAPLVNFGYFCEIVIDFSSKTAVTDCTSDSHCNVDTDRIRRERGVHTFLFQVVVGTIDTKQKQLSPLSPQQTLPSASPTKADLVAAQEALLPSAPSCPTPPLQPSVPTVVQMDDKPSNDQSIRLSPSAPEASSSSRPVEIHVPLEEELYLPAYQPR